MNLPIPTHHYYASCCLGWAVAATRTEAVAKLAKGCASPATLARQVKVNGGLYVWTCRVHTPIEQHYNIEDFRPSTLVANGEDTGVKVPLSDVLQLRLATMKGACFPID